MEERDSILSDRGGARRRHFRARDALVCIGVAAVLLVLLEGRSVRNWGEQLSPGVGRSVVLAVGRPAAWLAGQLPFEHDTTRLTAFLRPTSDVGAPGGAFSAAAGPAERGVPPVPSSAFPPAALGQPAPPRRPLHTVLVTGDSLSTPLDVEIARRLASHGIRVLRDPHLGTGISKTALVDWGRLSTGQVAHDHPDATVVFIGANEGFPMRVPGQRKEAQCCGAVWAAEYAFRARRMMDTYRQGGASRVYWLTVPAPRDPARAKISRAVNAADTVAAQAYAAQVRILDTVPIFTPGFHFRDAMNVGGEQRIVREPDGIHLNETGAGLAADRVVALLRQDWSGF